MNVNSRREPTLYQRWYVTYPQNLHSNSDLRQTSSQGVTGGFCERLEPAVGSGFEAMQALD